MRPIDTQEIQTETDQLTQRREYLNNELEEVDHLKRRLPDLDEERARLAEKFKEKKDALETRSGTGERGC
jgi:predicted nuclease with TOPRIM domain